MRKPDILTFSVLSHREEGTSRPATSAGHDGAPLMREAKECAWELNPTMSNGGRPWEKHHAWRATGLDDTGSWSLSPSAPGRILLVARALACCPPIAFFHVASLHPRSQANGPVAVML